MGSWLTNSDMNESQAMGANQHLEWTQAWEKYYYILKRNNYLQISGYKKKNRFLMDDTISH